MIGEIDCREGILLAVERDYYETFEDGIKTTLSYFLQVLKNLRMQKNITIYIHPIPPVLPETRKIVTVFNQYYKKAIIALEGMARNSLLFCSDHL